MTSETYRVTPVRRDDLFYGPGVTNSNGVQIETAREFGFISRVRVHRREHCFTVMPAYLITQQAKQTIALLLLLFGERARLWYTPKQNALIGELIDVARGAVGLFILFIGVEERRTCSELKCW